MSGVGDYIGVMARPRPGYDNAAVSLVAEAEVDVSAYSLLPEAGSGAVSVLAESSVTVAGEARAYIVRGYVNNDAVVSVGVAAVIPGYAEQVLADNPFLFYRFADATPLDSSGNNRTPVYEGGSVAFTSGASTELGSAISLAGDGGHVTMPTLSANLVVGGTVTIEAWIRPTEVRNWARICDMGNGNGYDNLILARPQTTNNLVLVAYNGSGQSGSLTATNALVGALNVWTHVVGVISPTSMKIYVNGALVASSAGCTINSIVRNNSYVGLSNWWQDSPYKGDIDEFALYSYELSATQIANHFAKAKVFRVDGVTPTVGSVSGGDTVTIAGYLADVTAITVAGSSVAFTQVNSATITLVLPAHAAGTVPIVVSTATESRTVNVSYVAPVNAAYVGAVLADTPYLYYRFSDIAPLDETGNAHTPVYSGIALASGPTGGLGNAASFDGVGSYVKVAAAADMVPSGSVSIEAWVYMPAVKPLARICDLGSGGPYDAIVFHWAPGAGNTLNLVSLNGSSQGDTLASPAVFAPNTWMHLVGVITATGKKIYMNGALVASTATGNVVRAVNRDTAWIGRSNFETNNFFSGRIDEFAIYSYELSAARVLAHYNAATA